MKYSFQTLDWKGQLRTRYRKLEIGSWYEVKYVHMIQVPWRNETEK